MLSIFLIKCYLIHCADPFCWYGVWSYLHFTIHSGSALFLFDFQRKCSYFSCAKLEVLSLFLPYTAPAAAPAVAAIKIADNEFLEKEHHMSSVMYGVSPYTTVFCLCFRSWSRDLSERVFVCPAVEAAGVFSLTLSFCCRSRLLAGEKYQEYKLHICAKGVFCTQTPRIQENTTRKAKHSPAGLLDKAVVEE